MCRIKCGTACFCVVSPPLVATIGGKFVTLREKVDEYGSINKAAAAMGIPRSTLQGTHMNKIITKKESINQGLNFYFTGKPCKNGHICERKIHSGNCVQCAKDYAYLYFRSEKYKSYDRKRSQNRVEYRRSYNSSQKAKEATKKYSQSEKGRETARRYRQTPISIEKRKAYHRSPQYKETDRRRSKNPERLEKARRYSQSERNKSRLRDIYANNESFRIMTSIRVSVRNCLNGKKKPKSTLDILGCSISFFRDHLEKQFRDGMTWDNYGKYWHLDHIKPLSTFDDLTNDDQLFKAQHYTNIQPLLAHENLAKNANEYFCLDDYKRKNPDRYV